MVLDIPETVRKFLREELKGMYTVTMVIVENVQYQERRVTVSQKSDDQVFIDDVPIASPFASDGAGLILPVKQDDEGFVLHSREPMKQPLAASGHVPVKGTRRFTLEDAVFFPMVWHGDATIPSVEDGDLLLTHDSGTLVRMKDDGTAEIVHSNGNVISMNADGSVTLGDPASAAALLNENAVIEYEDTGDTGDGSATPTTKQATISDPGTADTEGS